MRFLIDECLTVRLVSIAVEEGYAAQHVAHVGKAGWKDWHVLEYARTGDFVLVTNNATDFRKLYASEYLHAGLVILLPSVDANLQQQLFRGALKYCPVTASPSTRCWRLT